MSNPYEVPRGGGSSEFRPSPGSSATTRSGLAIVSLVSGVLSLLICFVGLLAAPVAILTGHLARSGVRRSGGRVTGGGLAAAGLVLGYLSLVLNLALLGFVLTRGPGGRGRSPGEAALAEAERQIITDTNGSALGNSGQARDMARSFATVMESLDKLAFTQTNAKIKLSGGHYVTWCELRPGRCAFLVHVPEYRRFQPDAKAALEKLAWATAQKVAGDALKPGDRLAVGLKGTLLYGAVMVGEVSPQGDESSGPRQRGDDRSLLSPFFADSSSSVPVAPGGAPDAAAPSTPEPGTASAAP